MKVILIEAAVIVGVALVLYLIRNKIRFFRGGYVIRRDSYMQDDKMKLVIEDTCFFKGKERNCRSLRVDGSNLVYSRIPLDKNNKVLMVYSYCAPLLAMVKGGGVSLKRTLVLGGGGSAVPLYIAQSYDKAKVDVVEISGESIRISKEHFVKDYAGEGGPINMILADAQNAVKTLEAPYQFIFCDLYIGGQPADAIYNVDFMNDLSRLAGENGMLVINGGSLNMLGVRIMLTSMLSAFKNAWVMLLGEGFVLAASNKDMPAMDNLLLNNEGVISLYPNQLVEEDIRKDIERLNAKE